MKGIDLFRFLAAVWAVLTFGAAFFLCACDGSLDPVVAGNVDSATDADTDADSDSDADTDTDTDTDYETDPIPEECHGSWGWEELVFYGVCQVPGSTCSGGYNEYPELDCPDGLWCCIDDDQCAQLGIAEEYVMYCAETDDECPSLGVYFSVGCPDTQVCCLGFNYWANNQE